MSTARRRALLIAGIVLLAMTGSLVLDPIVLEWVRAHGRVGHNSDLMRLLRVAGYAPAWGAIALGLVLIDRRARARGWWDRGAMLMLSVLGSAGFAELIKLVIRRERPGEALAGGVFFEFRSFFDGPLSSSGIGFPSSHAAVAFGGAFMLARVAPGCGPVVIAWALGCGTSRVLASAHYTSDVVGAAVVGYACCALLWAVRHRGAARSGVLAGA